MKDITVSIDEDTYRRIHVKAAEQDTSVSELVRRFLSELAAGRKIPSALNARNARYGHASLPFAPSIACLGRMHTGAAHDRATHGCEVEGLTIINPFR